MFHPPIENMDRSITTFGSILAFITIFFTSFSFITIVLVTCPSFFQLVSQFQICTSRALRHVMLPTNSFNHFSKDLLLLLLDTNQTLLRSNDSFVHPSRGIHPTQKFVCRPSTLPEFCCTNMCSGRSCLSPVAEYSSDTCKDKEDDVFGAYCWNRTVFLKLSSCSSFAVSDPLLPMLTSLLLFSSCCLSSSPDGATCLSATCSSILDSKGTSPAPLSTQKLLFFFTRPFPSKFPTIVLIRFRRFSSMRCQRAAQSGQPPV